MRDRHSSDWRARVSATGWRLLVLVFGWRERRERALQVGQAFVRERKKEEEKRKRT
jgi:hypothetical protein